MYHENAPGLEEGDYDEHPEGWIQCGYEPDGPFYTLTIGRGGDAILEQWEDSDFETELCPAREIYPVSQELALQLWSWLADGEIDLVKAQPWQDIADEE